MPVTEIVLDGNHQGPMTFEIDAKEMATFPIGEGIDLRVGRYGPYVEGPAPEDGDGAPVRANVPDDLPPDELTVAKAKELLANPAGEEQVRIISQQWSWTFVHPGPDGKLDTADDIRTQEFAQACDEAGSQ